MTRSNQLQVATLGTGSSMIHRESRRKSDANSSLAPSHFGQFAFLAEKFLESGLSLKLSEFVKAALGIGQRKS